MVYINDKKFACKSCVKGHRSSSCHHNDRPLFEIKKKGRPVSQCEKCRELRKRRRVHSKCMCDERKVGEAPTSSTAGIKPREFVHIAPALQTGVKGALPVPPTLVPPDPRQKVESLLNPCSCRSVWSCHCLTPRKFTQPPHPANSGLATLAQVVTTKVRAFSDTSSEELSSVFNGDARKRNYTISRTTPPTISPEISNKRRKELEHGTDPFRGPELPPLLHVVGEGHGMPSAPIPRFSRAISIPPMEFVASLAGTGCCCGYTCACPECIEHRVPSQQTLLNRISDGTSSPHGLKDCADGCGHCVDRQGGIEASSAGCSSSNTTSTMPPHTVMEEFLARAASLPTPPRNRFINLDPTNIITFPTDIFCRDDRNDITAEQVDQMGREQIRAAWGLVNVPKLDCCSGFCGCSDGNCQCGKLCGGCCADEDGATWTRQRLSPHVPSVNLPATNEDVDDNNETEMNGTSACCCRD